MTRLPSTQAIAVEDAGLSRVLEAAVAALQRGDAATLAVVLDTEGSTYARAGTVVLFSAGGHAGWLSGGCLEPEIERAATQAAARGRVGWIEIDTRDDAALFGASAVGCRGCQRVALLPLNARGGVETVFRQWLDGAGPLQLQLDAGGGVQLACAGTAYEQTLPADPLPWPQAQSLWSLHWPPPPRALLLGAGPEAAPLLPLLQGLGWQVQVLDPRATWRQRCQVPSAAADASVPLNSGASGVDAVLVMHHNFELDLQALQQLAQGDVPFIGLLGPRRRRDDLFKLLDAEACKALQDRLHSPVGLDLGGRGPDAIALSIAAQLQSWRHAVAPPGP